MQRETLNLGNDPFLSVPTDAKPAPKKIKASSSGVNSGQRPKPTGVNTGYAETNGGQYRADRKRLSHEAYSQVDMLGLRYRFVNFGGNTVILEAMGCL